MTQAQPESQSPQPPPAPGPFGRVMKWLQGLVQASAILAAAGYLSLRSHFNYLGVSANGPIGAEAYLRECAYMAYEVIGRVALPALLLGFAWMVADLLGHLMIARKAAWRRAVTMLGTRGSAVLSHSIMARVLLAYLLVVYVYMIEVSPLIQLDAVAIGPLKKEQLEALDFKYFDVVFFSCLVAFWLCHRASTHNSRSSWWNLCWLATLLLCVHLPNLFGRTIHARNYQVARVTSKDPEGARCGLLILNTGKNLVLWRVQNGVGEFLSASADANEVSFQGKPVDLLETARQGERERNLTLPHCLP